MFTGIIRDVGEIREAAATDNGMRAVIQTRLPEASLWLGASISCAGACLTVVEAGLQSFTVDISPETLARTNLKNWEKGTAVNLEPALKASDTLDGHILTGHVDGLATIRAIEPQGNSWKVEAEIPAGLQKFIAEKGSVTLDGVSLTVNKVKDPLIELMIIPHTWQHTSFCHYKPGDQLNLEIDILARYLSRLNEKR